jgi:hypothetical protein
MCGENMARARKARLPELIRTAKDMVEGYELALKLSGKVRPAPEQLARQKEHYTKAAEVIQPPPEVIKLARDLAGGLDTVKLLNLWRRAHILAKKTKNLRKIVAGIRQVIEENNIPREWAEPILTQAITDKDLLNKVITSIFGARGAAGAPAGTPPGL